MASVRGALLLLVSQQVALKLDGSPEFSGTLVTRMQPPFLVCVPVLQQMKAPAEALVTGVTHKNLLCSLHLWGVSTSRFVLLRSVCRSKEKDVDFTRDNI